MTKLVPKLKPTKEDVDVLNKICREICVLFDYLLLLLLYLIAPSSCCCSMKTEDFHISISVVILVNHYLA